MAIAPFLAMTAAEMCAASSLPPKIAWMACHFSPYALGLSNLPRSLPTGSLLIVDDFTPPHGHDPILITEQLWEYVEKFQCCGVLLDFQRENSTESASIAKQLMEKLPCPVAVSELYAKGLNCPVFLPLLPPSMPLQEFIQPWKGRELWLELGTDGEMITLREKGAESVVLPCPDLSCDGHQEETLHCHYTIETDEKSARFTLWRTNDDMEELLEEAAALGITTAIGLFQELHEC